MALPPPSDSPPSPRRSLRWLLTLVLLTLLSVATGGGFGLFMIDSIEKRVEAKYKAAADKVAVTSPYSGDIGVQKMAAVVTNMVSAESYWVRMEASIVYKKDSDVNPEVMAAETRQDVLAYLRTLSVPQLQGPSGLLHLREDLNERAQLRSKGVVRELVIESLVVQ